ncbi:MAG: hypothetical protein IKV39_02695 [Clostridia bacterium]|nr:hypothetical protein [Clostridia bacterium]
MEILGDNMGCVPRQKRKPIILAIVVFLALSAGVSVYFRLWGVGFLALFLLLYVLARYLFIEFCYIISPRGSGEVTDLAPSYGVLTNMPYSMLDLTVTRKHPFGEPAVQSILSLQLLKETVFVGTDRGKMREIRKKYKAENGGRFVVYDYTVTPCTRDGLMLVFEDGEEYIGVLIEADEAMRKFFEIVG